jgi:flagellar capping protein FliD
MLTVDAGSLTSISQGLTQQISDLQAALAAQEITLTSVYSKVNATLQQLPLLESQMTQQLAGIP